MYTELISTSLFKENDGDKGILWKLPFFTLTPDYYLNWRQIVIYYKLITRCKRMLGGNVCWKTE